MVDWPIIHLLSSTEAQRRDAEWLEHSRQIYRSAKAKRAEVIEALLSVEGLLDEVLLDLLVGRDASSRDRLRELVLAAEFCGTHQKWKMLRSLMESAAQYFEPLGAAVGGELRRDIKDLNDHRNRFAHGDLFVDARDSSVLLRYSEGGDQRTCGSTRQWWLVFLSARAKPVNGSGCFTTDSARRFRPLYSPCRHGTRPSNQRLQPTAVGRCGIMRASTAAAEPRSLGS